MGIFLLFVKEVVKKVGMVNEKVLLEVFFFI